MTGGLTRAGSDPARHGAQRIASCLYRGTIRHRRSEPAQDFTHRLTLAYIDLAELPELLGGRLVRRTPGPLRFRRADYLGPAGVPLEVAVRDRVTALGADRPAGPVRLLTQLRSWGTCFNPVSFYYCFDPSGRHVESVLAEVTNTPWGERHSYLLSPAPGVAGVLQFTLSEGAPRLAVHGHGSRLRRAGHRAGSKAVGAHRQPAWRRDGLWRHADPGTRRADPRPRRTGSPLGIHWPVRACSP